MDSPNPASRRPGGQPGNTNAVKHGYHSPRFHSALFGDPVKVKYTGVSDEIEMLRKSIHRVVEMSEDIQSLRDALSYLRVLSLASMSLSRLVRAHKIIADSDYEMSIGSAVSENGATLDDAGSSKASGEYDPTIEWAKYDPPEELLDQYLRKFDPSEFGEKVEDDDYEDD